MRLKKITTDFFSRKEEVIRKRCYALNDSPQPHVEVALGLLNLNPVPCMPST